MGTNYYARIIPTKKRQKELCNLIKTNDFDKIQEEIGKTYGSYDMVSYDTPVGGVVHLGKKSYGWKFLWNPNAYIKRNGHMEWTTNEDGGKSGTFVEDPSELVYVYPLTKNGIEKFISKKNIEIVDEYGEIQDKKEFLEMAYGWTKVKNENGEEEEAWDAKSYEAYERSKNASYYPYVCRGEYINMLIQAGYRMGSYTNSDFYSDNLRFATSTDFS